ncbi:DinB family protein [Nocardioides sambongensis]|uniref:DinB family protein n=1 Tax=Nocardioides sambongensis TaxID=2589074 RepID=UPI00112BE3CB|nr:DinB family protein [Nocardioides sambongensis]
MNDDAVPVITPDTKDWTWVLERACPECGFDASRIEPTDVAGLLRAELPHWRHALAAPTARRRPAATTWSPSEYGCHVRDVHRVFAGRVRRILDEDGAVFADWDQDATAVAERYHAQEPATVLAGLQAASADVSAAYDAVPADAWTRVGVRSNGSRFTLGTLAAYHLHDVVHHRWDVARCSRP